MGTAKNAAKPAKQPPTKKGPKKNHKGHYKRRKALEKAKKMNKNKHKLTEEQITEIPRSFVFARGQMKLGKSLNGLLEDWKNVMLPYSAQKLKIKKQNSMKSLVEVASQIHTTHFIMFTATEKSSYMRIARLPRGPTITFRIDSFSTMKDVQELFSPGHPTPFDYAFSPLVVLNHFNTNEKHLQLVAATFKNMFPPVDVQRFNVTKCKRVILFDYQQDRKQIEVRHYRIRARNMTLQQQQEEKARLKELAKQAARENNESDSDDDNDEEESMEGEDDSDSEMNAEENTANGDDNDSDDDDIDLDAFGSDDEDADEADEYESDGEEEEDGNDSNAAGESSSSEFAEAEDNEENSEDSDEDESEEEERAPSKQKEKKIRDRQRNKKQKVTGQDALTEQVAESLEMQGKGGVVTYSIQLEEIGPRLTLSVYKIQDDLCKGDIIYHNYIKLSPLEIKKQKEEAAKKNAEKLKRKQKQDANVKRKQELQELRKRKLEEKKKLKEEQQKQRMLQSTGDSDEDMYDYSKSADDIVAANDDSEDDAEYYKREVGETPDPELFPKGATYSSTAKNMDVTKQEDIDKMLIAAKEKKQKEQLAKYEAAKEKRKQKAREEREAKKAMSGKGKYHDDDDKKKKFKGKGKKSDSKPKDAAKRKKK